MSGLRGSGSQRGSTRLSPFVSIAVLVACVAPADPASGLDVEALAAEAVASNPGLEALRARSLELEELAGVSGTWSDPVVSVEYVNAPVDTFSIRDSPMSGVQFTLRQRLPRWGWARASEDVAESRALQSRHAVDEAALQLRRSVETLYWELTLSRQLERVTRRHLARSTELERAVRARYEVGRAGQNALLRFDILRDRLSDDLGDFARAEEQLTAGLSRALSRPQGGGFETPDRVSVVEPRGTASEWVELAKRDRPALAAIREAIEEEERAAQLSRTQGRPDVDVWVRYRVRTVETLTDDGTDFFSAGISIPIPLGSAKRSLAGVRASNAAREGARARLAAEVERIASELTSVEAEWRRAAEKASRYEERLIPAARSLLETTLSEYAVGRAGFTDLYEAEVELLTLERAHLAAVVQTHVQRAAARAVAAQSELGGSS